MSVRPIALILLCALLAAQTPSTPPQQVIRVTTHLVEINAIVRDKGKLVSGLTASDFELLDNGKPQKISVFSTSSRVATQKPSGTLPPNVFTNTPRLRAETPNNVTAVLLDGLNTPSFDKPYARQQFIKFLQQLHADDRVAVYVLGRKLVVLNDFTNDAQRLLAAVEKYSGDNLGVAEATDPTSPDYGTAPTDSSTGGARDGGYTGLLQAMQDAQQAAADFATLSAGEITTAALEAIANHLASVPGRKSLVWITSSIPLQIDQAMRLSKAQSSDRRLLGEQTFRAVKALNDGDIAVYPVDARGLVPGPAIMPSSGHISVQQAMRGGPSVSSMGVSASHDSLLGLAQATGGQAFYNSNDIKGAIRKAIDDSEYTYNLGFYPASNDLDATFHEIKVHVKGKSYEVRSRNGYRANPEVATTEQQREKLIRDALWSPIPASGIELAVRAEKAEVGVKLTLAVGPQDLDLESKDGKWVGAVDYVVAQRTADGSILNRKAKGVALNLEQAQYERLKVEGMTFSDTSEPLPGAVELRVVLLDRTSGRIGSVMVPLKR